MKKIIDCETGEEKERQLNKSEKDQQVIDQSDYEIENADKQAKEAAKAAILDRIGLTADELQTILG
jgi:hypothetical protein